MRSDAPTWRFVPTLRFLAFLPLSVAVGGLALEIGARALGMAPGDTRPVWYLAVGTGVVHVFALALVAWLLRLHERSWPSLLGVDAPGWFRHCLFAVALTGPVLAGAWLAHQGSSWLLDLVHVAHDRQEAVNALRRADATWEHALMLVFAVGTAPLTEEVLFRGILWPWARDAGHPVAGALITALVFALIHANLAALLPLWLLGLFWIWLYERTRCLAAPILSHAIFNLVNFAWILLSPEASPT